MSWGDLQWGQRKESAHERVERFTKNKDWKAPGQIHHGSLFQRRPFLLTYNSVSPTCKHACAWQHNVIDMQSVITLFSSKRKELAKLTTKEQFVFTLVRLRRNPSLEMLCDIFGITTVTGSRINITWILFLEKELVFLLPFSTKEELREISDPIASKRIVLKIWEQ